MFIDSHAHIDGPEFDADRTEVIQRALDAGVSTILNVGTGDPHSGTLEHALEIAGQHAGVFSALGVHPHDAKLYDDGVEERILTLISDNPGVVAWGEIGLDFHYDNSPREVQLEVFRRQLRVARQLGLPVIIHTREAEDETIQALQDEWSDSQLPGVMHCFSGSQRLAQATSEMGLAISFAGIVTFKKAEELRDVATKVPLENLLIETDCPFLAPIPYRGKRNEPAFVVQVARCLADLKGVTLEEIGRVTSENFHRIFQTELRAAPQT